jgi:hypothetical protein
MMARVNPDEWRERVGQVIEARRVALRMSVRGAAAAAGFSEGQWRQMESGRRTVAAGQFVTVNPRPGTRAAACRVLRWTDDSIDRLEAGDAAEELAEPASGHLAPGDRQRIDRLEAEVARLGAAVDVLSRQAEQAWALAAHGTGGFPVEGGTRAMKPNPRSPD